MSPVRPVSPNSLFSSLVDPSFNSNLMKSVRESLPQPERFKPLPDEEFSSSYPGSLLWSLRFIPILVGEFPQKFREVFVQFSNPFDLVFDQEDRFRFFAY